MTATSRIWTVGISLWLANVLGSQGICGEGPAELVAQHEDSLSSGEAQEGEPLGGLYAQSAAFRSVLSESDVTYDVTSAYDYSLPWIMATAEREQDPDENLHNYELRPYSAIVREWRGGSSIAHEMSIELSDSRVWLQSTIEGQVRNHIEFKQQAGEQGISWRELSTPSDPVAVNSSFLNLQSCGLGLNGALWDEYSDRICQVASKGEANVSGRECVHVRCGLLAFPGQGSGMATPLDLYFDQSTGVAMRVVEYMAVPPEIHWALFLKPLGGSEDKMLESVESCSWNDRKYLRLSETEVHAIRVLDGVPLPSRVTRVRLNGRSEQWALKSVSLFSAPETYAPALPEWAAAQEGDALRF